MTVRTEFGPDGVRGLRVWVRSLSVLGGGLGVGREKVGIGITASYLKNDRVSRCTFYKK